MLAYQDWNSTGKGASCVAQTILNETVLNALYSLVVDGGVVFVVLSKCVSPQYLSPRA